MNKKILKQDINPLENILKKYSKIEFTQEKDKIHLENILFKIFNKIDKSDNEKIKNFIQIIEYSFINYSSFDKRVLYNPLELIDSLLENDFFGKKIDTDEVELIINKISCFEKYLEGKMKEKEFLEKKYGIKIIFIEEDISSINAGIFGTGLKKFSKAKLVSKLIKLLNFYPINFIKNIKLDSIIIVEDFFKKDIYGKKILLGGFETLSDNNIYLSRKNLLNSFDHELYHQSMQYYDDFDKWLKIRKKQRKKYLYKNIDKQVFGFARNYGKENVSEDQATMAEELILNYYNLQKRIQTDKRLRQKLILVKKAYFNLSDGVINEKWWREKYSKKLKLKF